ncbi:malonyl-ACP O-methyltransferase BioC [Frateuria aurantia]
MSDYQFDRRRVRRNFSKAADSYEQHDALQVEVQSSLLERMDFYLSTPQWIVDVGAGTGRGTARLKQRYPKAEVVALDHALPMLQQARRNRHWLRPFRRAVGDALALPLTDHSVDILHSNLCFQWIDDLPGLFAECVRVLKPGGMLVFSTLGPDTLHELRAAWAAADGQSHVSRFLDMHDVGDAMLSAGLRDPVLDMDRYTLTYAQPRDLLLELKGLGASHADQARLRGLTGRQHYRRMLEAYENFRHEGRIPASWEVITAHAWGPPHGQPRRDGQGGELASFPLDQLRGSRMPR